MSALTSEVPLSFFNTDAYSEEIFLVYEHIVPKKGLFGLTSLGLVLFIFVDEEETGTLGAEG